MRKLGLLPLAVLLVACLAGLSPSPGHAKTSEAVSVSVPEMDVPARVAALVAEPEPALEAVPDAASVAGPVAEIAGLFGRRSCADGNCVAASPYRCAGGACRPTAPPPHAPPATTMPAPVPYPPRLHVTGYGQPSFFRHRGR